MKKLGDLYLAALRSAVAVLAIAIATIVGFAWGMGYLMR